MINFDDTKVLMQKAVDHFTAEIASIRTGRAVPSLVEDIVCPAYGGQQRLKVKELAGITLSDAQTLVITPWDNSIIGDIRKGILEANVGLTPILESALIRVPVPPLTGERREEYIKLVKSKLEECKISIRNARQDKQKDIKQAFDDKTITEDEKFRFEKELQELTDGYAKTAEEMAGKKEDQISMV